TKYAFEYGREEGKYEHKTSEMSAGSGTSALEENEVISGLLPATEYHFRMAATNSKGTSDGAELAFTTEPSWTSQPAARPEGATASSLKGISCLSATSCSAVGEFTNSKGERLPLTEGWSSGSWSLQLMMAPPKQPSSLASVSCSSTTACTAVGHYTPSANPAALAERWNGTEWATQELKIAAPYSDLRGVCCPT